MPEDFRATLPERKEVTVILMDGILSISQPSGDEEQGIEMLEMPIEDAPRFLELVQRAVAFHNKQVASGAAVLAE